MDSDYDTECVTADFPSSQLVPTPVESHGEGAALMNTLKLMSLQSFARLSVG